MEYVDRRGTNCCKWDGQNGMFGQSGLHAMWVADMDIKVPECVRKVLHDYVDLGIFGYVSVPDSYYEAFINWEQKRHGCTVKKEWLRFSPGVVSAFNWIVQFMTKEQDAVIVTTPVYYPFLNAVKDNRRTLITSDLKEENGIYTIDFEDFEKKIEENQVKLFILCSPHNPIGRVWKQEELQKLFEICRRHNVFVISDEIHQDLVYGGHKHVTSLLFEEYRDMMIVISAPSKTFNLAGAQNSFVIIPDSKIREKWDLYVKAIHVTGGNAFGYIAAEAAYRGGEEWLEEVKGQILKNYEYLKETLTSQFPEITVSPLEGTYLAWIDLGAYVKPEEMRDFMQKKCRMAVDYGDWFGGERFGGHIRINLATSMENMKIGAEAICANLK